jgi:putative ABC transport system permease protein
MVSGASLDILYKNGKLENLQDDWANDHSSYGYVLLRKDAKAKDLDIALTQLTRSKLKTSTNEGVKKSRLASQVLTSITPGNSAGNNTITSLPLFVYYILGGLAFVILLSATLNYTSISVARALTRATEIGIRKVNGAGRKDIIYQFMSEAMMTIGLSFLLGMLILTGLKSAFLNLWINQFLHFELEIRPGVYFIFIIFTLIVGFIAGVYPALHLSGIMPINTLKKLATTGNKKHGIRRILTVAQFTISLLFIISTLLIYSQFRHFNQFDYGFRSKNVLNINLQGNEFEKVRKRLQEVTGVEAVSGSAYLPATGRNDNLTLKKPNTNIEKTAIDLIVNADFIKVMDIQLVAGQNLPADNPSSDFILVNETATKDFGFKQPKDMVGQVYDLYGKNVEVAGVIKDFTFFLLFSGRQTGPIVLHNNPSSIKFASLNIPEENKAQVMSALEAKWKTIDAIHPFEYEYYDDQLEDNNQGIFDIVSIIGLMAGLAIIIACLGLLGLVQYIIERRTKEIGIRKVLGADSLHLNYLLSKEFLILLGISILIGAPASYFLNHLWLDFIIYRAEFGAGTILGGSLLLLVLGLLTIIPQTIKIINRNPTEVLKIE